MATPIVKDELRTHDTEGNVIIVYPKTSDDQVAGLDKYVKSISCDDHTITCTKGDGSTYEVEVNNDTITEEEILTLWDITDSSEKYY
ncbi:MAG: hypothetical protein IJ193_07980 [Bacilli bacterium]|nr:hypothetical protein [Bacilli bacterium]